MIVISSIAQTDMFLQMIRSEYFKYYEIIFINIEKWNYKEDIEKKLNQHNLTYRTIEACRISAIKKLLLEVSPNVVIFGHDRTLMDKIFIKCSNSLNIPSLLVQDGILSASRDESNEHINAYNKLVYLLSIPFRLLRLFLNYDLLSFNQKMELILLRVDARSWGNPGNYGHGKCKKIAVFGDATKDLLISEGIDPQRIIVTGNPKFDSIYHYKNSSSKQNVCKILKLQSDKDIFLLITQHFVEAKIWSNRQRSDFIMTICRAISTFPNAQLIIKLHPPYESETDYRQIIKDLPEPPIICKDISLHELINACTAVMAVDSTAGLEAMAMGKPVMIMNLFNSDRPSFYRDSGAFFAHNEREIVDKIWKILFDSKELNKRSKSMQNFVYYHAHLQDGKSSKRISELIERIATI